MATIQKPVLESAARISTGETTFVKWLEEKLEEYKVKALLQPDDVQMRTLQGRGQELMDIIKVIKEAPMLLRKA